MAEIAPKDSVFDGTVALDPLTEDETDVRAEHERVLPITSTGVHEGTLSPMGSRYGPLGTGTTRTSHGSFHARQDVAAVDPAPR